MGVVLFIIAYVLFLPLTVINFFFVKNKKGKNERDGTLTKTGKVLVWILDKIDNNHSIKSIDEKV